MQTSRNLIKPVTTKQLKAISDDFSIDIQEEELSNYLALVNGTIGGLEILGSIPGRK